MKKVLGTIFWILVIALMCLWTFEFYRVRNGLKPLTCLINRTHTYFDGKTNECIGLGFKVYDYQRDKLYGTEFVSIFASERKEDLDSQIPEEDTNDTTVEDDTTIDDIVTDDTTKENTPVESE